MNKKKKTFEEEILGTFTFDPFTESLLKKSMNFFQKE